MPIFTALAVDEVKVGRAGYAARLLVPYVDAISHADAGKVELAADEKPGMEKHRLSRASKSLGVRIRSRYEASEHALYWKRVANRTDWGGAAE